VEGVNRFLSRLWRLCEEVVERTEAGGAAAADGSGAAAVAMQAGEAAQAGGDARALIAKAHWSIDKATKDFERGFQFNTVIAAVMELVNDAYRLKDGLYGDSAGDAALRFATATAASLIFPFAPHLGSEVYERITGERVWEEGWPVADEAMLVSETVTLIVQVNGKVRARVEAPAEASQEELLALAKGNENVAKYLGGKEIVKEIVVPGKLVNLVVR
jgi:leucyl-tRNA synthetase